MVEVPIAVAGVGQTPYRRKLETSLEENVFQAVTSAIDDSGLSPGDIDGFIHAGYVPAYPHPAAEDLAALLGSKDRTFQASAYPAGGAGMIAALDLARMAINSGRARNVLVWFAHDANAPGGIFQVHGSEPIKAGLEMPFGWFSQPVYFAGWAQRYMYEYGLKPEQLAEVSIAARAWATRTPGAQKQGLIDFDDYMASPMIASPLRKFDCALQSDGAAAVVLTSLEQARDLPPSPVVVQSSSIGMLNTQMPNMLTQLPFQLGAEEAARQAFQKAGVTAEDIDFAEIYDCFSITMLVQLEAHGFCARGEAGGFVENGRIAPGGSFPVNTHGGHLSHGYMIGMGHFIEAVLQLRGTRAEAQVPNAEIGVVGLLGNCAYGTAVLTKDR